MLVRVDRPIQVAKRISVKTEVGNNNRRFANIPPPSRYDHLQIACGCQLQSEFKGGLPLKSNTLVFKSNCSRANKRCSKTKIEHHRANTFQLPAYQHRTQNANSQVTSLF